MGTSSSSPPTQPPSNHSKRASVKHKTPATATPASSAAAAAAASKKRTPPPQPAVPEEFRHYSMSSQRSLMELQRLEKTLEIFENEASALSLLIFNENSNIEDVLRAKTRLAVMSGELEKFQYNQLDAIETASLVSGREEVVAKRRGLNKRVDLLQELVANAHAKAAARYEATGKRLSRG